MTLVHWVHMFFHYNVVCLVLALGIYQIQSTLISSINHRHGHPVINLLPVDGYDNKIG